MRRNSFSVPSLKPGVVTPMVKCATVVQAAAGAGFLDQHSSKLG